LRGEDHDADRAAETEAEGTRDKIVVAAGLDAQVRRDRCQREGGQDRDRGRGDDDAERREKTRIAHHVGQAQEKNDAENCKDAGREHACERPQPFLRLCSHLPPMTDPPT
jgi:hypothetical protein